MGVGAVNRSLGVPAAAIVLVALPSLVAAPGEPAPPAKEAALTVNLEGEQGESGHPYEFAVSAEGRRPAEPAVLRDASGLHTATVAAARGCQGPARVGFPGGGARWCLRLEDVARGHELTGAVTGGGAVGERKLSLTVNRRDSFLWLPLLTMLAGFLAGAFAVLYKAAMREPIRSTVLGRRLRENRRASRGKRIAGLTAFVRDRLAAGDSVDDLIPKVANLLDNGPGLAKAVRQALGEKVEADRAELSAFAVWRAAAREAARTGHEVGDFLAEDGSRKQHPAAELNGLLEQMGEVVGRLRSLRGKVAALAEENRTEPAEALARAELVAKQAATAPEAARLGELLDAARDAVEMAQAKEATKKLRPQRLVAPTRGREPEAVAGEPTLPPPADAAELGGGKLGSTELKAIALTAVAVVAVLAIAVATVKQSTYDPRLTFGSAADYVSLFLAALGSAAAGSVLVLLGFWSSSALPDEG